MQLLPKLRNFATNLNPIHKFRIDYHKAVMDLLVLDLLNGNIIWTDNSAKEKKNFQVTSEIFEDIFQLPNGFLFKCAI